MAISSDIDADVELSEFEARARAFLEANAVRAEKHPGATSVDDYSVEVFPTLDEEVERTRIERVSKWQRTKFDAGFGAITWPEEFGGLGLSTRFERAFRSQEAEFDTPEPTELFAVTLGLIAPTISAHGSDELRTRFIRPLLRSDLLACQLFSEPGAGSDLASVSCRAVRDGSEWLLNGQKVWTSGAKFAGIGEAICRTDPAASKHAGLTAFIVPMDTPGVEVRPIRQITGGSSFNEVFLNDVRIPDSNRLGAEGDGWKVALTTLGFERASSQHASPGGSFRQLLELARRLGCTDDPLVRQELARVFIGSRLMKYTGLRVQAAMKNRQMPGPEGSIRKLLWVDNLTRTGEVAARMLGPRITADTGEWGTYAWSAHLLGAPGYHIAGGSDEIQRNIIGERVLGLPPEPRPLKPESGRTDAR
jgi:alkylation response protein AidB-like acyl-CoA dehydrogenase